MICVDMAISPASSTSVVWDVGATSSPRRADRFSPATTTPMSRADPIRRACTIENPQEPHAARFVSQLFMGGDRKVREPVPLGLTSADNRICLHRIFMIILRDAGPCPEYLFVSFQRRLRRSHFAGSPAPS